MPTETTNPGYGGNTAPMMAQDEAGATDNRLSLDPNDPRWKEAMDKWEDGGDYWLERVGVHQVSPGEFTVTDAKVGETGTEEEGQQETPEPEESPTTGLMGKAAPGSPNPAVNRMMMREGE